MLLSYYWKRECNVDVTWEKNIPICILFIFEIQIHVWIESRKEIYLQKGSWSDIYQLCWPLYLFSERIRRMQDILKEITVPTRSISHYVATSPFVDLLSYIHHHGPKNRTTWSRTEKVAQHTFPSPPWTTLKLKLNAIVGVKFFKRYTHVYKFCR